MEKDNSMKYVLSLLTVLMVCGNLIAADNVYLSDLQLDNIVQGYGAPGRDVSVTGEKIVIGDREFAKGV